MGYGTVLRVVAGAKWIVLSNGDEELFNRPDAPEDLFHLAYEGDPSTQLILLTPGISLWVPLLCKQ
jgi:hypothetical protein